MTFQERNASPESLREPMKGPALWSSAALVLLFWCWQFSPLLFGHQNLINASISDARLVGRPSTGVSLKVGWPAGDDSLLTIHFPYHTFLARSLGTGTIPLWNPGVGCGQPVVSDPQYKLFNPFFWPFFVFPSGWSFSLGIALMALFGMAGYFLYLRELRLSWVAVTLGAIVLSINPLSQQTLVLSSAWAMWTLGWGLWGCERARSGLPFGLPLAAASVGLGVAMGHPVIAALEALLLAGYALARVRSGRLGAFFAVLAGAAVLGAFHLLPFLADFSVLSTYKSSWDGGPFDPWWLVADPSSTLYLPLPFWGLALLGLVRSRSTLRWLFAAAMAYGLLVLLPNLGPGPLRWLLTLGGTLIARYGEEPFWLGTLGLAVLGAQSLEESREVREPWPAARVYCYGLVCGGFAAWAAAQHTFSASGVIDRGAASLPEFLLCLPPLVLPFLPDASWGRRLACVGVAAICATGVFLPTRLTHYWTPIDPLADPPEAVREILRRADRGERLTGPCYEKNGFPGTLAPNQALCWGLADARLSSPLVLEGFEAFSQHWQDNRHHTLGRWFPLQDAQVQAFLGARWSLVPSPDCPKRHGCAAGLEPLVVQPVPGFVPWVRAVQHWTVAPDRDGALRRTYRLIRSGDWRGTAVLEGQPESLPATEGKWVAPQITFTEARPNGWTWKTSGPNPSLLVVLQNRHRGWHAWVDGEPAPVLGAYGTFMALTLPAGTHTVRMAFSAPWFWLGFWLTLSGWITVSAWATIQVRSTRRRA